jgi:CO/xanthine dehydrogenase FAD-binding subunit
MLFNLKTTYKPATVEEAAALLHQPGTYPLYGGAALQRHPRPAEIEAAVDLGQLDLDYVRDSENSLRLGTMITLEQMRLACLERGDQHPKLAGIAAVLREDLPETLRHTLRLGDLLMERDPQSLTITTLLALGAVLKRSDVDMHFTMAAWLGASEVSRRYLIGQVRLLCGPKRSAFAVEKVARTPADAPIVAAAAYIEADSAGKLYYSSLALCGVAATPIPQPDVTRVLDESGDLTAALGKLRLDPTGDHWGSREYRIEMARVVARRALTRALEQVQ